MTRILIAASAALFATAASAQGSEAIVVTAPTARVSIADLNVQSVDGRAHAAGRIRSAAEFLCSDSTVDPLAIKLQRIECYRAAVDSGDAQLDAIGAAEGAE